MSVFLRGDCRTYLCGKRGRREEYLDSVTGIVQKIDRSVTGFLENEHNRKLFLECINGEEKNNSIRYQIARFNVDAPIRISAILADASGRIVYSGFGEDQMNRHRMEFCRISMENAGKQKDGIYHTVYFFSGNVSEYVFVAPILSNGIYIGSISLWLEPEDWGKELLKYQYDTILTDTHHNIIYCSNPGFLSGHAGNKFKSPTENGHFRNNGSRYLTGMRFIDDPGIHVYSFIYWPEDYRYFAVGVLIIAGLGLIWTSMFLRLMRQLAARTSESVRTLVNEMRIIRKTDQNHVIQVKTGDEIEEIALQINKMVDSIHDLNNRNMALLEVNNRMEMDRLQAQINPHFIYNTLENIRYLIVWDAKKADELIGRFTHILRYSINNTRRSARLCEDMEYINDYLEIQKTRFGKRFSCEIDLAPECGEVVVPKLLLQPLIENSLKYGFKKKPSICVRIRGRIEGEYMILQVEDDGPGQPKAMLETLRGMLGQEKIMTKHNGLQSINRRIMLEYGKDSGLSLESEENEMFLVTIRMWMGGNHV